MLGSDFAEGVMEYNPLQTPRPTGRTITGSTTQNEGGVYNDEYIDSDDEDDDPFEADEHDEVASQADSSETDFAQVNLPRGDETLPFSESVVQQDIRQVDDLMNSSQLEPTSASLASAPLIIPDQCPGTHTDRQTPLKAHSTVLIRGVAYNTYRALLYYVGDNLELRYSTCSEVFRYILTISFLRRSRLALSHLVSSRPLLRFHHRPALKTYLLRLCRRKRLTQIPRCPGRNGSEIG